METKISVEELAKNFDLVKSLESLLVGISNIKNDKKYISKEDIPPLELFTGMFLAKELFEEHIENSKSNMWVMFWKMIKTIIPNEEKKALFRVILVELLQNFLDRMEEECSSVELKETPEEFKQATIDINLQMSKIYVAKTLAEYDQLELTHVDDINLDIIKLL